MGGGLLLRIYAEAHINEQVTVDESRLTFENYPVTLLTALCLRYASQLRSQPIAFVIDFYNARCQRFFCI